MQASDKTLMHLADVALRMRLDREAVALYAELEKRKIPMVVLKGPATAYSLYPNGDRMYGDIDLLVPSERFGEVELLLSARLYVPAAPSMPRVRSWIDRRFPGTERAFVCAPHLRVDLHRSFHLLRADDAWRLIGDTAMTVDLPIGRLRVPDAPGTALIAVLHASTVTVAEASKAAEDLRRAIESFDADTWAAALDRCRSVGLEKWAAAILRGLGGDSGFGLAEEHLAGIRSSYWESRRIANGSVVATALSRRREYTAARWVARLVVNTAR